MVHTGREPLDIISQGGFPALGVFSATNHRLSLKQKARLEREMKLEGFFFKREGGQVLVSGDVIKTESDLSGDNI
ncbi:hypothetical protein RRG08_033252 [Elysia crispata]|uniref:Uncharacterized protein n=1 Tax=Elysia crispata TaxID=231223 RepID=A0AAE0ZCF0_9GAST|nr:hypothetical protein RRG08_033252 [Elysia crispata]